ncbi:iron ABC transporter substrate-binding protein [Demequina zhanjiangensis]|uniref:Iron ABC transporter substrate-binding protein n=1 Tax=Demequina zhanjiangensis TaxID=3051659 RepID=A0ABT8FYY7_9MICO|nr:iron ABC transporter substrate-binding protein [Demequina sp. SYSU T00b26]MDN4472105.1 iron ABC transporter substrate-binding protein [Demequina sp. SYSU T00b26]
MAIARTLAAVCTSVLVLAGCAQGETSDPSATAGSDASASSDGTLTLYSGREEDLVQPLIDQFTADTGIEVEVRYAGTTELAALLQEEGAASPADVFLSQDAGALGAVAKADLFATLPESITTAVDPGFTSTDGSWVGVTGRARVLTYDSEALDAADVPASVLDLTDPEWNGKVGIAPTNASFQSFVTALRVLEGEDVAREWLEGMVENDVQLYPKNTAILEAVQAGEIELGLINHYYWYRALAELGEDGMRAQLSFPAAGDAGSIVNVTGAGLLDGAADDADALAFLEYLVSEDGQQYFVDATYEYPLAPGIDAPEGLPALADLTNSELDLSDLDTLGDTTALLTEVGLL